MTLRPPTFADVVYRRARAKIKKYICHGTYLPAPQAIFLRFDGPEIVFPIAKSTENSAVMYFFACGAFAAVQNLLSQSCNHIIQLNPNSQGSLRATFSFNSNSETRRSSKMIFLESEWASFRKQMILRTLWYDECTVRRRWSCHLDAQKGPKC